MLRPEEGHTGLEEGHTTNTVELEYQGIEDAAEDIILVAHAEENTVQDGDGVAVAMHIEGMLKASTTVDLVVDSE